MPSGCHQQAFQGLWRPCVAFLGLKRPPSQMQLEEPYSCIQDVQEGSPDCAVKTMGLESSEKGGGSLYIYIDILFPSKVHNQLP